MTKKEIKSLLNARKDMEKQAKEAVKIRDFIKAAELYNECKNISNDLFVFGLKKEAGNSKHYSNLESEARLNVEKISTIIVLDESGSISEDIGKTINVLKEAPDTAYQPPKTITRIPEWYPNIQALSMTYTCITDLLTRFGDDFGYKYYSEDQELSADHLSSYGIFINSNNFLQKRLTNPKTGGALVKTLNIDPKKSDNIKAIQFIYTHDLTENSIKDICNKYNNPDMFLFIIGTDHKPYNKRNIINLPKKIRSDFKEHVRIIDYKLQADLIGLEGQYKVSYNYIFESNYDLDALNTYHEEYKIKIHTYTDLQKDLI